MRTLVESILVAINWKPAPHSREAEVVAMSHLSAEFVTADLFPLVPVEEPEFLVGRQEELQAVAEAHALWEKGRRVSVLIVGRAGSGKTSLVNVAARTVMDGLPVIRGEIRQRVTTEAGLRALIAEWIGVEDPSQLERALTEKRRVIVLEQVERAFLRKIGQCDAIRALQRLIAATSLSTFWVVPIGENSLRFLDTAVALGRSFSHRVNVSAASRDDLRRAIQLRHNVSGLSFEFRNPPAGQSRAGRIARRLRSGADAETQFFDALWKESGGLFRTALAMWLRQIERIDARTAYVRPMSSPSLPSFAQDLDLTNLFTLVALLQHGSLTVHEHAEVFLQSVSESQVQMDQLAAREIIEPVPQDAGFRVRPEAFRLVYETLYRRNLL